MKLQIDQIAIAVGSDSTEAMELLKKLGLTDWTEDTVVAFGEVFRGDGAFNKYVDNEVGRNCAQLSFNYQSTPNGGKPLELEILSYTNGPNWTKQFKLPAISHVGMHVVNMDAAVAELRSLGLKIVQQVQTESHTNPAIKDRRRYRYVIFDTRAILGFDIKLIQRLHLDPKPVESPVERSVESSEIPSDLD